MKQFFYTEKNPELQKIIIASALLHVLFLFLVTVPMKSNNKEYKSYVVDLVAPAELKTSSQKEAAGQVKAKPKLLRRAKTKAMPSKRVNKEIDRLRAISAISKLKEKKDKDKLNRLDVVKQNLHDEAADAEVAGRIEELRKKKLSGAGIPGRAKPGKNTEVYYALITQKIWSEWICHNCETEDFEVIISFHINKDGSADSLKVVRSSGNSFYDNSAMKAVRKASPLPPPVLEDDCEVRFRP